MLHSQRECDAAALVASLRDVIGLCESPTCDEWFSVDDDADEPTVTATVLEFHQARRGRKEGVVAAPFDVLSRFEMGTTLADQDGPTRDLLSVTNLGAETLGVRVATVSARTLSFFVRHGVSYASMVSTRTL
jgi:hypothetical protein